MRCILLLVGKAGLPEQLAVGPVEAHHCPAAVCFDRLGDEHAIAPDDRSGIAAVGEGRFPSDIFRFAPGDWKFMLCRDTARVRPAPGRPIGTQRGCGSPNRQRQEQKAKVSFHGAWFSKKESK